MKRTLSTGYFIDQQGIFIQPYDGRLMMFNINDNYTQALKNIVTVTTPIAVSLNYEYFAVGGCTKDGKEVV
jgi:hypothetical protein